MLKKKNIFKYIFLLIISSMVIFNGGNNNLYIQFNFLIISIFFLLIIKEKNNLTNIKSLIKKNNISFIFYFLFILFLLFQILPLPIEWLKFFSYEKYHYLNNIEFNENFHSISLSPTDSYFSMLNYLTLFLSLIIFKSLFNKKRNILKFYFFLTLIGAFAASIAIYLYLIGNPEFWIIKNPLKKSATGFFISRTIFSCFLVLCFFSGIEYFKKIDIYINHNHNNFFNKIYVRIFLLLIAIGIITSFSRLGNFLFISLILFYLLREFYLNDKKDKIFLFTLSFIFLFDVLILGFYFGSEKLVQRYSFLQNEIITYLPSITSENMYRGDLVKFALNELNKYIIFGYGPGGFEYLFKTNFEIQLNLYASHVHSDLIEFLGEFGLVGSSLILISIIFVCKNNNVFSFKNFILLYLLFFILIFDFSFHSPIIQLLFILLFSVNYEEKNIYKSS